MFLSIFLFIHFFLSYFISLILDDVSLPSTFILAIPTFHFLNWLCFVTIFFHLKVIEIYHFFFNTFLGYDASFVRKVRLFVIYYFSYYSPFQWKRIWGYSSKGLVSNQTKIKKQRTSARSALISWCYLCVMRYFTRIRPRERSLLLATIIKRI